MCFEFKIYADRILAGREFYYFAQNAEGDTTMRRQIVLTW